MKKLLKKWLIGRRDKLFAKRVFTKEFKKDLKGIKLDKKLTSAQKHEIQTYFMKHYGQKVRLDFHEAYYQFGDYSVRYIPDDLYRSQIVYKLNDFRMRDAYIDKNFYDKLFANVVKQPEAILRCINGLFYTGNYEKLTKEEALKRCFNLENVIIKPTMETTWGKGVRLISIKRGIVNTGESLEKLFKTYRKHFIIQKRVQQHPALAALNPTSVNTIRVTTFRRPGIGEVVKLWSLNKIGGLGSHVDNQGSGGYTVKLDDTGKMAPLAIMSLAHGPNTCKTHTDVGVCLEGYQIPSHDKVIAACIDLHRQLPYFNLVGWDMSVDEDETPVMIEWNVVPEIHQHGMGPIFGNYTEEVLHYCRAAETTRFIKLLRRNFND